MPEAEVLRPSDHGPIQAFHHHLRRLPAVLSRRHVAHPAAGALDARLAGSGASVRLLADPDIVLRGDRRIDETRVPASQPIVGAATSAPRSQVASLAERDEPGRRLAFRELKQLGRGPAVQ